MKMIRWVVVNLLVVASTCFIPVLDAGAVDIQVYKGELRILAPGQQVRNSLLIRYRSKTREIVRIGISGLELTNTTTKELIRLDDRSASLVNHIDHDGYWNTDITYDDLDLGDDNYRIEGRLTQYLIGSQRTRNFSVYLKPESSSKPPDSSIDWGISD